MVGIRQCSERTRVECLMVDSDDSECTRVECLMVDSDVSYHCPLSRKVGIFGEGQSACLELKFCDG